MSIHLGGIGYVCEQLLHIHVLRKMLPHEVHPSLDNTAELNSSGRIVLLLSYLWLTLGSVIEVMPCRIIAVSLVF